MKSTATHEGYIRFVDLHLMVNLSADLVKALPKTKITCTIFENPDADNLIFLCDLQTHERGVGGTFRCFLYPDNKVLGTYKYLAEAVRPDYKIDGKYDMENNSVRLTVKVLQNAAPSYGALINLEALK